MMKKLKNISTLLVLSSMFLSSCGKTEKDFSSYVPATDYCKSELSESSFMNKVCNLNKVETANNEMVDAFNSDLIYSQFPYDTLSLEMIYDIETIMGKRMIDLHKSFDRHNSYLNSNNEIINNLKAINESYGTNKALKVDDDLFDILELSLELGVLSEGRFNIAVGNLSDFWNDLIDKNAVGGVVIDPLAVNLDTYNSNKSEDLLQKEKDMQTELTNQLNKIIEEIPSANELKNILILNKENKTVKFNKYKDAESVSLSLGGIGKGYAVEDISTKLVENGYTYGTITGATSSNAILGKRHDNKNWSVGISSPSKYDYLVGGYLKLNNYHQMSTSGDSVQSYAFYDNDRNPIMRHHIINPNTGYPTNTYQAFRKVTIISKTLNAAIMDALSTILINTEEKDIELLLTNFRNHYSSDIEAIFQIADEKEEKYTYKLTKGLKNKFSLNKENKVEAEISYYEF